MNSRPQICHKMVRYTNTQLIRLIVLLCTCISCLVEGQQAADPSLMQAVGDHGDRISDLESIVKRLKSDHDGTVRQMNDLKAENMQLRAELREIINRTGVCCQATNSPKQTTSTQTLQGVNTTKATTSIASTDVPTTPKPTPIHPTNSSPITVSTSIPSTNSTPPTITPQNTLRPTNVTTVKPTAASTTTVKPTTASPTTVKPSTVKPTTTKPTTVTPTTIQPPTAVPTTPKPIGFTNCEEVRSAFPTGKQRIAELNIGGNTKTVLCEFDQNGAWLVIQHRQDGSEDFNRNWLEYQNGFGNASGEFWIGNEVLHDLTSANEHTLRIEFQDWATNTKYAEYEHFSVGSLFDNYMLSVGSYSGNAGDSFHYPQSQLLSHYRMMFSTPDRDHDHSPVNCADKLQSGWWFNSCYSSNLNGIYKDHPYGTRMLGEATGDPTLEGTGIEWYPYRHRQYSLKKVTMKIKLASSALAMMG